MQTERPNELELSEMRVRSREEEIARLHNHIGALEGHLRDTAQSLVGISLELAGDQRILVQAMSRLIAAKIEDAGVRAMTIRRRE